MLTGAIPAKVPDQNLINPAKKDYGPGPAGLWKGIVIDTFSFLSAFYFGSVYHAYLTDGLTPWYVFGAALAFCVASALQVFLPKDLGRRVIVIIGEACAFVIFFVGQDPWVIVLIAAFVSFAVLVWGYTSGKSRVRNGIEVQFFSCAGAVIGKVVTAMLLFMILVYIPQATNGAIVPQTSFQTFFDWSAGVVNRFYPNLSLNGTFGAFSESLAQLELSNNPTFQSLSPSQRNAAVSSASEQLSSAVAQTTGQAPSPDESVSDVVYSYIAKSFVNSQNQFGNASIVIWVIVLFLILRSIGMLFAWLAEIVALIFYEILLASGFMHISKATQMKEVIEY